MGSQVSCYASRNVRVGEGGFRKNKDGFRSGEDDKTKRPNMGEGDGNIECSVGSPMSMIWSHIGKLEINDTVSAGYRVWPARFKNSSSIKILLGNKLTWDAWKSSSDNYYIFNAKGLNSTDPTDLYLTWTSTTVSRTANKTTWRVKVISSSEPSTNNPSDPSTDPRTHQFVLDPKHSTKHVLYHPLSKKYIGVNKRYKVVPVDAIEDARSIDLSKVNWIVEEELEVKNCKMSYPVKS